MGGPTRRGSRTFQGVVRGGHLSLAMRGALRDKVGGNGSEGGGSEWEASKLRLPGLSL